MKAEMYEDDFGNWILKKLKYPLRLMDQAIEYREQMVEAIAETDDDLARKNS